MESFAFNFYPSAEDAATTSSFRHDDEEEEEEEALRCKRRPFHWLSQKELEQLARDRAGTEMVCHECSVLPDGQEDSGTTTAVRSAPIFCVDLETSSFVRAVNDADTTWCGETSDLVESVYGGGLKVWECSLDLVRYLAANASFESNSIKNVLELGCGHGLPSCFLLREFLQQQQSIRQPATMGTTSPLDETVEKNIDHSSGSSSYPVYFYLTDFNDFVIRDATLSNLVLNVANGMLSATGRTGCSSGDDADNDHANAISSLICQHVRLGHGDWMNMSRQLLVHRDADEETPQPASCALFDLILAAETIYSPTSAQETAALFARHLTDQGVGLVATKRYYFGVGGGSDAFRTAATILNLRVETVCVYDNGSGNIRELLRTTRGVKRAAEIE
jgi:hypothetical protein